MGVTLFLALVASPVAWCGSDDSLHVEVDRAGLVLGSGEPELYVPDAVERPESPGRLFEGARATDRIEYRQADGTLRRLVIDGRGWRLTDGEDQLVKNFRVPAGFRRGVPALLLGVSGAYAWFASTSHVLRIDLGAERGHLRSARIGRKVTDWIFLSAGETARMIDGVRVLRCEPSFRCVEEFSLPAPATQIARTVGGLLVATETGLVRLGENTSNAVLATPPTALCGFSGGTGWVAFSGDAPVELASVDEELTVHRLTEILLRALPKVDAEVAAAWADALVDSEWPDRRKLAEEFSESESAVLRRVAALLWRGEAGNAALARLWLLGHDEDPQVRAAAVHSSGEWCRRDETMPCRAVLAAFVNDDEQEVSWTARDLLLDEDPWAAIEGAPVRYRLEAVSKLSSRWAKRGEPSVRAVLERLAADADPSVRAAAQMEVIVR